MKLLFFSDVHGSPESLARLAERIAERQPEQLLLLGDALYHGPRNPLKPDYNPQLVVQQLNQWKNRLIAVRGNCDCEVDQMLLEFPLMADYAVVLTDDRKFFLSHGHLWTPDHLPPLNSGDVFVYGHTHIPQLERLDSGVIAFNPGSISLPKQQFPPSFGFYENGLLSVCQLENGAPMMQLKLT